MKRFSYAPERSLREIVTGLTSDKPGDNRAAVMSVLTKGPFFCSEPLIRLLNDPGFEYALVRAELLQFLQTTVRLRGTDFISEGIGTYRAFTFSTAPTSKGVAIFVDSSDVRDAIVLQLVLLLESAGIENLRLCPECGRLFLKTYRREFCNVLHQKRFNARKQRAKAKTLAARKARSRARQRRRPAPS